MEAQTYRPHKDGSNEAAGNDPASAYRRVTTLGKGAYGEAVLVVRRSDNAKFVIKEVQAGHMTDEELAKAQQEASVLRRLSHSNIIGCADAFLSGGRSGVFCIVTEFADRGDLSEYIKERKSSGRGYFPEGEVLALFAQLCRALRHVHGINILHRDLKSQNVFLASAPSGAVAVKLGDFGIAKVMSGTGSLAETQIGTPYYLSPEIYEDEPYGKKSDMWSLGVLWHEVAALELPFQAKNLAALARIVLTQAPRRLPRRSTQTGHTADDEKYSEGDANHEVEGESVYSSAFQDLIDSLLCKDPKGRPSAAEVMNREPLKAFLASDRGAALIEGGLSYTLDPALGPNALNQLKQYPMGDDNQGCVDDFTPGFATVRDDSGSATVEFSGTYVGTARETTAFQSETLIEPVVRDDRGRYDKATFGNEIDSHKDHNGRDHACGSHRYGEQKERDNSGTALSRPAPAVVTVPPELRRQYERLEREEQERVARQRAKAAAIKEYERPSSQAGGNNLGPSSSVVEGRSTSTGSRDRRTPSAAAHSRLFGDTPNGQGLPDQQYHEQQQQQIQRRRRPRQQWHRHDSTASDDASRHGQPRPVSVSSTNNGSDGRYHGAESATSYRENRAAAQAFKERCEAEARGVPRGNGGSQTHAHNHANLTEAVVVGTPAGSSRSSGGYAQLKQQQQQQQQQSMVVVRHGSVGAEFHARMQAGADRNGGGGAAPLSEEAAANYAQNRAYRLAAKARDEEDLYGRRRAASDSSAQGSYGNPNTDSWSTGAGAYVANSNNSTRNGQGNGSSSSNLSGAQHAAAVKAAGEAERERQRSDHEAQLRGAAEAARRDRHEVAARIRRRRDAEAKEEAAAAATLLGESEDAPPSSSSSSAVVRRGGHAGGVVLDIDWRSEQPPGGGGGGHPRQPGEVLASSEWQWPGPPGAVPSAPPRQQSRNSHQQRNSAAPAARNGRAKSTGRRDIDGGGRAGISSNVTSGLPGRAESAGTNSRSSSNGSGGSSSGGGGGGGNRSALTRGGGPGRGKRPRRKWGSIEGSQLVPDEASGSTPAASNHGVATTRATSSGNSNAGPDHSHAMSRESSKRGGSDDADAIPQTPPRSREGRLQPTRNGLSSRVGNQKEGDTTQGLHPPVQAQSKAARAIAGAGKAAQEKEESVLSFEVGFSGVRGSNDEGGWNDVGNDEGGGAGGAAVGLSPLVESFGGSGSTAESVQ